jgi:hypothetical protein
MTKHKKLAFSISEFAEISGLGRSFIYEEINARRLKVRKAGRRTIVLQGDALSYLHSLPVADRSRAPAQADEATDDRCGGRHNAQSPFPFGLRQTSARARPAVAASQTFRSARKRCGRQRVVFRPRAKPLRLVESTNNPCHKVVSTTGSGVS